MSSQQDLPCPPGGHRWSALGAGGQAGPGTTTSPFMRKFFGPWIVDLRSRLRVALMLYGKAPEAHRSEQRGGLFPAWSTHQTIQCSQLCPGQPPPGSRLTPRSDQLPFLPPRLYNLLLRVGRPL